MKYWNKAQNTLMLFAATALLFACSQEIEEPQAPEVSTLTVLTANTGTDTKISFDDQGATGVKLAWEAGDAFTVYDNTGAQVGTFTLNTGEEGASTGAFSGSVALIDGTQYTAVFPAAATTTETLSQYVHNMNAATQNGNSSTSHLSDLCYMQGSFTYAATGANLISFGHNYVLMTVKMAMPDGYTAAAKGTPNKLTFKNDTESYTLALGNNDWTGGNIVAYFMVKPAAATSRTLSVEIETSSAILYSGSKTSSKAWTIGKRYTVDFTTDKLAEVSTATEVTLSADMFSTNAPMQYVTYTYTPQGDWNGPNEAITPAQTAAREAKWGRFSNLIDNDPTTGYHTNFDVYVTGWSWAMRDGALVDHNHILIDLGADNSIGKFDIEIQNIDNGNYLSDQGNGGGILIEGSTDGVSFTSLLPSTDIPNNGTGAINKWIDVNSNATAYRYIRIRPNNGGTSSGTYYPRAAGDFGIAELKLWEK